ncbi:MAG: hypothetical protein CMH48_01260 [Muricauda sp.]|nr:DUF4249 domain-containing protein [Allomuricauda sp.]MBC29451.1 hypothetical protein [Allomuricauda sp.]|tara:strand:+ start:991 stop:2319 length:1329 start_codon:yes stop_codon:yes gene_type:complete
MKIKTINIFLNALLSFMAISTFISCVKELDFSTVREGNEKGLLVVEATLTDEFKRQKVYLSRSDIRLDLETDTIYNPFIPLGIGPRDSVNVEQNASIRVIGSDGSDFGFSEAESGTYLSEQPFALQNDLVYRMEITTADGKEYVSEPLEIKGTSEITDVYAERTVSDLGIEGIAIYVDSQPTDGMPMNYRYTYEETYKIIAPFWDDEDFLLTNYDPCALPEPTYNLEIVPRTVQNRVCYNTVQSNTIEQVSTTGNAAPNVERFQVRFIDRIDFIISHRYSILVRQLVQSIEAYSFYETLKKFSETESLFSQIQPGALVANVTRKDGNPENVLGYVEAVSVSEERIFFDYVDFFPGEELPPYPFNCGEHSSPESHRSYCASGPDGGDPCPQSIIERVHLGLITYTGNNDENIGSCPGPYKYVARICGDCTLLGENVVPDFWIE